jgi:outer membrane protein OmpA-like peptidoglycan-associated protein
MSYRKRTLVVMPIVLSLGLAGCASTRSVTEQDAAQSARMDKLEAALHSSASVSDATQARAVDLDRRIAAVSDQVKQLGIAQAGQPLPASAMQQEALAARLRRLEEGISGLSATVGENARAASLGRAAQADEAARLASLEAGLMHAGKRLDDVETRAREAYELAGGYRNIKGEVMYSVMLTEDRALYPINAALPGGPDRARLDELAARVKTQAGNYHLEIQGHTDNFGPDDYTHDLGRARAEAAKRYLNEVGGIPLVRMSVISYGATVADASGANRRRIVILVMR